MTSEYKYSIVAHAEAQEKRVVIAAGVTPP